MVIYLYDTKWYITKEQKYLKTYEDVDKYLYKLYLHFRWIKS